MLRAGPLVSLVGSPTVSPITQASCASDPFPPWFPSSIYFFALSAAPPKLFKNKANKNPEIIDPEQIQQGKLNDDQFALLKSLLRIDQKGLGIVQQTQLEGNPEVNAFAAAIDKINDKIKKTGVIYKR